MKNYLNLKIIIKRKKFKNKKRILDMCIDLHICSRCIIIIFYHGILL